MWGSQTQPWNQWALQPSMFNNVPHDEIDWAALAKQWIQMQQVDQPPEPSQSGPGPGTPFSTSEYGTEGGRPPPPPPPLPPHLKGALLPDPYLPDVTALVKPEIPPDPVAPFRSQPSTTYWHRDWEASAAADIDERIWPPIIPPPPPEIPPPPMLPTEKKTFDYGHLHDNPPLTMQTVDYNHMSDYSYNQIYTAPEDPYDQYWSQVASTPMLPPFLKKDRPATFQQAEEETAHIDAAKRKQLPAWIREGLEKMEQERLKRLEKERAEKENAERAKKAMQRSSPKKESLGTGGYESSSVSVPSKSKFDTDSEDEGPPTLPEEPVSVAEVSRKREPSPFEEVKTEEERQLELMLKVRKFLTEILLSVTNTEMASIARECYQKARSRAPARPLASSSALRSIASGLRSLASYDSPSEASGSEDEDEGSSTSDEELWQRIQEKKRLFAVKERKILADIERSEEERQQRKKQLATALDSKTTVTESESQENDRNFTFVKPDSESEGTKVEHENDLSVQRVDDNSITSPPRPETESGLLDLTAPLPPYSSSSNSIASQSGDVLLQTDTHDESDVPLKDSNDKNDVMSPKNEQVASKSGSSYSSDSESDSSSYASESSISRSDKGHKKLRERSRETSRKHSEKYSKKSKNRHRSSNGDKKKKSKDSRRGSSDSSRENRKSHSHDKSKREQVRSRRKAKTSSRDHSLSSISSFSSDYSHGKSSKSRDSNTHIASPERQRRRSWSYDRRGVKRKSRSPSRPMHEKRVSQSRSGHDASGTHYRESGRSKYREESHRPKKEYRHSRSRSSSRTPKRYRRKSRSPSVERGRHVKKTKVRYYNR